jgi:lysophospholipase L1-like esterase
MTDCLIIGDSIGVGIALHTPCKVAAQVGRASSTQAAIIKRVSADHVIISLGSNDPFDPELLRNLRRVRASINAKWVVWIVPYHSHAGGAVRRVADAYGDGMVELRAFKTADGVHPTNYRGVALDAMRAD